MEFNFVRHETGKKYAKNYTTSDDINAFDDSGIVIPENIIIVDIDTLPKNKIISLLKIFNIKTQIVWTERGIHLYFKKPRYYRSLHGSGFISLGFNVEYKHNKNTKSITIKRNGILRKIENQGNFEEFPEIFKKINDSSENLSMIGINHDRNNRLYSHKFKIIGKVSEYKKCLQFINQYLFEEPLPDKEFEVVSREEKVIVEKNGESKIAEVIAVDKKIKLYNGDLYFYNGVYYEKDLLELKKIVGLEYCYMKNTRYIDEVIKQLEYIFAERILDSKSFVVKLKNGVLKDGLFIPSEYDDFTPFYIDHEYIPETKKVPEIEEFLNFITDNDQGYINLLLEMMAYCLVTDPYFIKKLSKFFLIVGKGGNGKGTLITIVQLILGKTTIQQFHSINLLI